MNSDKSQFTFEINAKDIGASSTLRKVRDQLDGLKEVAGKGSFLGQAGSLLKGGGALAGVTMLTSQLAKAAEKGNELAAAVQSGSMSISEAVGEGLRAIPVLGEMTRLTDALVEGAKGFMFGFSQTIGEIEESARRAEMAVAKQLGNIEKIKTAGQAGRDAIWINAAELSAEQAFRRAEVEHRKRMAELDALAKATKGADQGQLKADIDAARLSSADALARARVAMIEAQEKHTAEMTKRATDAVIDATEHAADASFTLRALQLQRTGDIVTLQIERIKREAAAELAKIAEDVQRRLELPELTTPDRDAIRAQGAKQSQAVREAAQVREQMARNEAGNEAFRRVVDALRATANQNIPHPPQRGAIAPVEGLGFAQSQLSAERASFDPLIRTAVEQKRIAQDQLRALRASETILRMIYGALDKPVMPIFQ